MGMRTRREAIENLKYLISGECCDSHMDYIEEIEMAITDMKICEANNAGWISVKDDMPKEHPSIFAPYYGTEKWNRAMWRKESDRVLVAIRFPDGTRTVDKGRLQDGVWKTGVSPVLPQEVTHWAMWPEPPKEEE